MAHGAVSISEIAWMGIDGANGQFGEWVELYNEDNEPIDLSGWQLFDTDGATVVFTLSKTIPANGYLLIERTTASMLDPVPEVHDEQGSFGGGGLSNGGEDLVLKDAAGTVVVRLLFAASGWPAGDATTKETMQWNGSAWVSAAPTPKASLLVDEEERHEEEQPQVESGASKNKKPEPRRVTPRFTLSLPNELYQYVEYQFEPTLILEDGLSHKDGPIRWNFGDGTSVTQKRLEPVTHAYRYPGTYTLWIGYYKSVFDTTPQLSIMKTITVGSPSIALRIIDGEAVQIENQSTVLVDLSGWQLFSEGVASVLPEKTLIAPRASVVFSAGVLGFHSLSNISIARPNGERLALEQPRQLLASSEQIQEGINDEKVLREHVVSETSPSFSKQNRTKKFIFGAILLIVSVLCLLLERAMAKRE